MQKNQVKQDRASVTTKTASVKHLSCKLLEAAVIFTSNDCLMRIHKYIYLFSFLDGTEKVKQLNLGHFYKSQQK